MITKNAVSLILGTLLWFSFSAFANSPDCTGADRWPANMAENAIIDRGLANRGALSKDRSKAVGNSDSLDYTKTKVVRLASEKIGKDAIFHKDLYRQIHRITFVKKSGEPIVAITVSDASHIECSMSDVDVYVVSERLGAKEKSK